MAGGRDRGQRTAEQSAGRHGDDQDKPRPAGQGRTAGGGDSHDLPQGSRGSHGFRSGRDLPARQYGVTAVFPRASSLSKRPGCRPSTTAAAVSERSLTSIIKFGGI